MHVLSVWYARRALLQRRGDVLANFPKFRLGQVLVSKLTVHSVVKAMEAKCRFYTHHNRRRPIMLLAGGCAWQFTNVVFTEAEEYRHVLAKVRPSGREGCQT